MVEFSRVADCASLHKSHSNSRSDASGYMTMTDCGELMTQAVALEIPHLAWTFHQRCPPNLIVENAGGCGEGMELEPTDWGRLVMERFAEAW